MPAFAEAFGVTEQELRRRIRETAGVVADEDGLMDRIKSMCGGYRFSRDTDAEVIHPALCQAYLQHLAETGREPVGTEAFADEVADVVGRLRRILSRGEPDFVRSVVDRCLKGEAVACPNLSRSLPLKPEDKLSDIDVLTVLFSLGGLTLAPGTGKTLACPNQVIREQVFGRLAKDFGDWGAAAGKRRTR